MELYHREQYLKKIRPFYDDDLIKVITGIRRCGKSCLMSTIAEELRNRGVEDKDIIYSTSTSAAIAQLRRLISWRKKSSRFWPTTTSNTSSSMRCRTSKTTRRS